MCNVILKAYILLLKRSADVLSGTRTLWRSRHRREVNKFRAENPALGIKMIFTYVFHFMKNKIYNGEILDVWIVKLFIPSENSHKIFGLKLIVFGTSLWPTGNIPAICVPAFLSLLYISFSCPSLGSVISLLFSVHHYSNTISVYSVLSLISFHFSVCHLIQSFL